MVAENFLDNSANLGNFYLSKKRFHFVGIGGIGMSGIAEVMLREGIKVTGSDSKANYNTERLEKLGAKIYIGHAKENIKDVDVVVISSAIKPENPEVAIAIEKSIPVVKRAEMLAEIMKGKNTFVVAGSHGKTTTTSLVDAVMQQANLCPTVINGGIINSYGTNAYINENSNWIVAESDESDGSFIKLPVSFAIVTNIDPEHLDFYGTFDKLIEYFKIFISKVSIEGFAVVNYDNETLTQIANQIQNVKIFKYSVEQKELAPDLNAIAKNVKFFADHTSFDVCANLNSSAYFIQNSVTPEEIFGKWYNSKTKEITIKDIQIPLYGIHNISNALAVVLSALNLGIKVEDIKAAFEKFQGVKRRFSVVGNYKGVTIVDDYGHHPTEIRSTLSAAKNIIKYNKKGKLIAVIEPHRYSRLNNLLEDFASSTEECDIIMICDVYAASEAPIPGVNKFKLCHLLSQNYPNKEVIAIDKISNISGYIANYIKSGDISEGDFIICLGAGALSGYAGNVANDLKQMID